jgi:hypothetical protein
MKELAAVKDSQKATETRIEIPKELAALPEQVKELATIPATLKQLSDRLDALEKNGTARTKSDPADRELEDPVNAGIVMDTVDGTPVIRRA